MTPQAIIREPVEVRLICGDALQSLWKLPCESVNCVVTSPPYWGLRDYGVDGQIGLEQTPDEYVGKLVDVFREVRRVLKEDGTVWLNIGDSYTEKDLCGIPWQVAFALQADGWWLRQDIIWAKPNPMPESVRDRCTRSHEYVFLLTKSAKYWYDADAISEPLATDPKENYPARAKITGRGTQGAADARGGDRDKSGGFPPRSDKQSETGNRRYTGFNERWDKSEADGSTPSRRNKRSVWTITPKPFKEAHFATFPPELPELCIRAGCPLLGTVLDPFAGAGTTGLVARNLGRHFIGIELNPAYIEIAKRRLAI